MLTLTIGLSEADLSNVERDDGYALTQAYKIIKLIGVKKVGAILAEVKPKTNPKEIILKLAFSPEKDITDSVRKAVEEYGRTFEIAE